MREMGVGGLATRHEGTRDEELSLASRFVEFALARWTGEREWTPPCAPTRFYKDSSLSRYRVTLPGRLPSAAPLHNALEEDFTTPMHLWHAQRLAENAHERRNGATFTLHSWAARGCGKPLTPAFQTLHGSIFWRSSVSTSPSIL